MHPAVTAKYLDLFTDYGFKKIFGEEANKAILIDFLNALLPAANKIKDLTFRNTEQLGVRALDRKAVYDIYCENQNGEKFIVELQKVKQNYFKERTIYYSTFPISEQSRRGDWEYDLKAVFCIGLLDFTFDDYKDEKERQEVVHTVMLKDQHGSVFYRKLTYIYLEMPNFKKQEDELETRLDKWLYFIKNLEDFKAIPEIFRDEVVFVDAMHKAELAKMTDLEIERYNASLKVYRDNYAAMKTALDDARRIALEEGMEQGREQGIEQGIEQGRELGIAIGAANMVAFAEEKVKQSQIDMAQKCLLMGMNKPDVANLTGLSEEEVNRLAG